MRHFLFHPHRSAGQRAFTFVELLVVLAISALLLVPFVAVSISMQRVHQQNRAKMEALNNTRNAMETLCYDLKHMNVDTVGLAPFQRYLADMATTADTPFDFANGDRIDNNGINGTDEQSASSGVVGDTSTGWTDARERHAVIPSTVWAPSWYERRTRNGNPWAGPCLDLGDVSVADDTKFSSTTLSFNIDTAISGRTNEKVKYELSTGLAANAAVGWLGDSSSRVLMRTYTYTDGAGNHSDIQPLAFDILSFRCLYWNPNAGFSSSYWTTSWQPSTFTAFSTYEVPETVYLEIVAYADVAPISSYKPGTTGPGIQTITLRTAVNIEPILSAIR